MAVSSRQILELCNQAEEGFGGPETLMIVPLPNGVCLTMLNIR